MKKPSFDYEKPGLNYAGYRQTDPYIAKYIHTALGSARTVLNVGAGAGSYEPDDRYVIAVEPSSAMRAQRQARQKVPALTATADTLPFDDQAFDASMALITVHHWPDMQKGLQELRRVTRAQVIVMTFDPAALDIFWNVHYFPQLIEIEKSRYPTIDFITASLGGNCTVQPIPIPLNCLDGFQEAYYGRPEAFLRKEVRVAQSAWGFLPPTVEDTLVQALADDLQSGAWDQKYASLRTQPFFTGSLRLITALPEVQ